MAGFDENEAEAIASNWVQNLRFRFARMGLNYHSDSKELRESNDNVVDPAKKNVKVVEERSQNDRKTSTAKDKVVLSDLPCKKVDILKSIEPEQTADLLVEDVTSYTPDQDSLITTRSEKSCVNLESLREKRLNFFQPKKSSMSFDTNNGLKTINVSDTIYKSVAPKKSQKVTNESHGFQNGECYAKHKGSGRFDAYNESVIHNETPAVLTGYSKFENGDFETKPWKLNSSESLEKVAWGSSKFSDIDCSVSKETSPRSNNDGMSLLNDCLGLKDSFVANECQIYLPIDSSEDHRSLTRTSRGYDNVNSGNVFPGQESAKFESKEVPSVFPIELDDDDFDVKIRNTQHELPVGSLVYDSDSDLDFTLDDPISRHTSPRVEDSPFWEHLRQNSGAMSPLAQSVSPPAPQITGALYHEFSCSDKDLNCEALKTVTMCENNENNLSNNENNEKAHQRPRSLSHPSTARDCSERCGSSYSCCCANRNEGVDVVCNVLTKKDCVDVEISYGASNGENIMPSAWLNSTKCSSSKHNKLMYKSEKNSERYSYVNSPNKDSECVNMPQNNWMFNSVKNSKHYSNASSPNTCLNSVNDQYLNIYVCPECNEINHSKSNWCSECGATLGSTKPISSNAIDLRGEVNKHGKILQIPKTQSGSKQPESSKTNALKQSPSAKKSVSIPRSNSDSQSGKATKNKPKQNGRRWEKSNLAWSTYQDSHLSKPPGTKKLKNHSRKSSIAKDAADDPQLRSTSCRNAGKRLKAEDGGPGSLPRSYKFREFKNKKANPSDHGVGSLTLKGIKATEKKIASHATCKTNVSDCTKYGEITEMIRTNREKPQPYLYLPDEIILRICCHLSHSDLARCSRVCRQLERISQDELLWRTIVLRRNQNISDEFLEKIGSKKPVSLSLIKCHGNLVTSSGLRELSRRCAENLEELNFIGCNGGQLIGESILLHVALRCNKLRSVDASWSNVGDNGVEALVQNVERLECLCLNGCQAITDHSLKVVADKHGESLRTFEIFGCFNVSATAIKRLGQKCPNMETLNLGQCYKITSSDIGRLVSHLESIINLDLRGCKQARDACVKTIVKHCPHLVNLVLANCPLITDVAMSEIATNLSAVRCLDVCGCVKVTDHGVRALARSCSRLNSLDLSSTSITQKSVMLLANYCSQNLQSLKLSFCVDVTYDSVSRLVKHCTRMKTLHLYGCKRLRNVKALQELNQSLNLEF